MRIGSPHHLKRRFRPAGPIEHPDSEAAVVAQLERARRGNLRIRARGAAHSGAKAIYTNERGTGANRILQESPPAGPNLNLELDRLAGLRVRDAAKRIVEADAGIHLGEEPTDPSATLERSLLYRLWQEHGWTLPDVGGIIHQTVAGFTATASAGGSVQHSFEDSVIGFRVVAADGSEPRDIMRGDREFPAMFGNLGLQGLVTKVIFQCEPAFYIRGTQAVTLPDQCGIDLFGEGTGEPLLHDFLRDTEYARIEWWPQAGAQRVVVWQAKRVAESPGEALKPYRRFGSQPTLEQSLICVFYTILGNVANLHRAQAKLKVVSDELRPVNRTFATTFRLVVGTGLWILRALDGLSGGRLAPWLVPNVFPVLLRRFLPLDDRRSRDPDVPQKFYDEAWHGLPMDTALSDVLIPAGFTEIWVPLDRATALMQTMRDYFTGDGDPKEAYRRTGVFTFELYAAKPSSSWLSPAYTDGSDEWSEGAFRFNAYWFGLSAGRPEKGMFDDIWRLLRSKGFRFRLHWGKFQPVYGERDDEWVEFFRGRYKQWQAFLDLRKERDPHNHFLTRYWVERFGLWDEPVLQPNGTQPP